MVLDAGGRCAMARVGITGVTAAAYRAQGVEDALHSREPTDEVLTEAAAAAADGVEPNADVHASGSYRRHLARVLTRRALEVARDRARARRRPAEGSPAAE
jgi:carbon-monoxide dehydrogenase medium subunit